MAEVAASRRLVLDVPDGVFPGLAEILVLVPESAAEIREREDQIDLDACRVHVCAVGRRPSSICHLRYDTTVGYPGIQGSARRDNPN